jgi:Protein of unknown function (DUF1838)
MIGRRGALCGLAASAALASTRAGAVLAKGPDPVKLLPSSPEAGLGDFIRMFAGLDGSRAFTNEGIIYGKVPGELPKPLFGFLAVLDIRAQQVGPALYRSEQKEAMVYLDLTSRQPLRRWTNVYTGEDQTPVGYVSPTNVYFFDTTGSAMREPPKPGTATRAWRTSATDIWVTESRYSNFPASITEAEFPRAYAGPVRLSVDILTYRAKAADFADRSIASVPIQLTMMSDTPWPLWMMMGRNPGGVFWHGFGQKYARMADLPRVNRDPIEQVYPGFLADPWGFPSEKWGTAAQLRRMKAAGTL